MNMSKYWEPDEQAWIMPVLVELNKDGSVDQAADWPDLEKDIHTKLTDYGASDQDADALVRPLTDAVASGEDFRILVDELSSEYGDPDTTTGEVTGEATGEAVAPVSEQAQEQVSDPAFEQALPPVDELARAVINAIGTELAGLITAEAAGAVSEQQLGEWVAEDVAAAIDEIAKLDWAF